MKTPQSDDFGFKRALVPLDGSMVAEAILPAFLPLAQPLGMELALIRVVVPTVKPVPIADVPVDVADTAPSIEHLLEEANAYLRAAAAMIS